MPQQAKQQPKQEPLKETYLDVNGKPIENPRDPTMLNPLPPPVREDLREANLDQLTTEIINLRGWCGQLYMIWKEIRNVKADCEELRFNCRTYLHDVADASGKVHTRLTEIEHNLNSVATDMDLVTTALFPDETEGE